MSGVRRRPCSLIGCWGCLKLGRRLLHTPGQRPPSITPGLCPPPRSGYGFIRLQIFRLPYSPVSCCSGTFRPSLAANAALAQPGGDQRSRGGAPRTPEKGELCGARPSARAGLKGAASQTKENNEQTGYVWLWIQRRPAAARFHDAVIDDEMNARGRRTKVSAASIRDPRRERRRAGCMLTRA